MTDPHPLPGSDSIVDGLRLHVVTRGSGDGGTPPVLLLHGLATSSALWRDVARDLGHGRLVLAPDLVGLGRSERPAGPGRLGPGRLGPGGQAAALLGLLDALGHSRVVVVGHEVGGAVAVALAARAPERVAALALLGSPLHTDVLPLRWHLPFLLPGAPAALSAAGGRVPALTRLLLAGPLDAGGLPPQGVLPHADRLRGPGAVAALSAAVRAVDPAAVESDWRLVAASPPPLLLLWGSDDRVLSAAYGRRLAAEVPDAVWVPVAGGGHLLPEQCPERVAEEVAAFVGEAVPTAQSADQ
jgi:2-hydroxymuconate-semialdehyde hydrolase